MVNLEKRWREIRESLLDLLFPPSCLGCGQKGEWFCRSCQSQMAFIEPPICLKCGQHLSAGQPCTACQGLQIDAIRSVVYSEGVVREAIHQFKYNGVQALAVPLGQILYAGWQTAGILADVLVPVPLHAGRVRERGYNQSQLLAEQLAEHTGLPIDHTTLRRVKYTLPQVDLNAAQRRENVADAFRCDSSALAGHRVVLVDDVCTTGATLEACSIALREAGTPSVSALTLARARGSIQS